MLRSSFDLVCHKAQEKGELSVKPGGWGGRGQGVRAVIKAKKQGICLFFYHVEGDRRGGLEEG